MSCYSFTQNILKLRLRIILNLIIGLRFRTKIEILLYSVVLLIFVIIGLDKFLINITSEMDNLEFIDLAWKIVLVFSVIIIVEGIISTSKNLYNSPESTLLLSLPVNLKHFFCQRWFAKLSVNWVFILFLILIFYKILAPSNSFSGLTILLMAVLLLLITQLQFVFAILFSRKIFDSISSIIHFTLIMTACLTGCYYLFNFSLINPQQNTFLLLILLIIILGSITYLNQKLFEKSYFKKFNHSLFLMSNITRDNTKPLQNQTKVIQTFNKVSEIYQALLLKDLVLFLRNLPFAYIFVAILALLISFLILFVRTGQASIFPIIIIGGFSIFIWTIFQFEYYAKQSEQLWLIKILPLKYSVIFFSKMLFIITLTLFNIMILSILVLFAKFSISDISFYFGLIVFQALFYSLLSTAILLLSAPFYKSGLYMYLVMYGIILTLCLSIPFLIVLVLPLTYFIVRKSMKKFEKLEI